MALIQAAQNQKQTNTGGLAKLRKLKTGAKVMLTVNIDIQDRLINGQTGVIRPSACKVYIKFFDEQSGSKAMGSSYLGIQNSWVPIEKFETEISIKKSQHCHPSSVLNFR